MLYKLINDNEISDAPIRTMRHGKWHSIILSIGKDHIAEITLDDEALLELNKLIELE